jgi:hypothetical protein
MLIRPVTQALEEHVEMASHDGVEVECVGVMHWMLDVGCWMLAGIWRTRKSAWPGATPVSW